MATIIAIFLLLLVWVIIRWDLKTVTYKVKDKRISRPLRLLLITDLHSSQYGENQGVLTKAIDKENPDIVLLSGDIEDDKRKSIYTYQLLAHLQSRQYPCFYAAGNHEFRSGEITRIKETFTRFGIEVLSGEMKSVVVNGNTLTIAGVDDSEGVGEEVFFDQLEEVSKKVQEDKFSILLAHRPEYTPQYKETNFDLILCGHAHGGQWRIPGLLNGLYAPQQGWFPKFAGGEYSFKEKKVIVSRGLDRQHHKVPRIFNRPELVVIELERKEQE